MVFIQNFPKQSSVNNEMVLSVTLIAALVMLCSSEFQHYRIVTTQVALKRQHYARPGDLSSFNVLLCKCVKLRRTEWTTVLALSIAPQS